MPSLVPNSMEQLNLQKNSRFAVGLSFPNVYRDRVQAIAELLSEEFTQQRILYDHFHQAEFARPDLDTYLQDLYLNQTELVVVFICDAYKESEWCGVGWRAIRSRINEGERQSVMFLKLDKEVPDGFFDNLDGSADISLETDKPFPLLLGAAVAVMGWERVLAWTARGCPPRRSGFSWLLFGLGKGAEVVAGSLCYRFFGIMLGILRYCTFLHLLINLFYTFLHLLRVPRAQSWQGLADSLC